MNINNFSKDKLKKIFRSKKDRNKIDNSKSKCIENDDGYLEIQKKENKKKPDAEKEFNKCKKGKTKKRRKSL